MSKERKEESDRKDSGVFRSLVSMCTHKLSHTTISHTHTHDLEVKRGQDGLPMTTQEAGDRTRGLAERQL